jgi:hypothetical protein
VDLSDKDKVRQEKEQFYYSQYRQKQKQDRNLGGSSQSFGSLEDWKKREKINYDD